MSETYAPAGTVSATVVSRFSAAEAATGTFGTMDRVTTTELIDRTRYLDQTGQLVSALAAYIGDNSNANVTLGLTINQGAADDQIVALKSSDVAHGITTDAETDTYGALSKAESTSGGLQVRGFKDSDGTAGYALYLRGSLGEAADTTKSTAAAGVVAIEAAVKSGTATGVVGADGNLVTILDGGGAVRFIFDAEGSGHGDVSWVTF